MDAPRAPAASRFTPLRNENRAVPWRGKAQTFRNLCDVLSLVIRYRGSDLVRLHAFPRYVAAKLPRRGAGAGGVSTSSAQRFRLRFGQVPRDMTGLNLAGKALPSTTQGVGPYFQRSGYRWTAHSVAVPSWTCSCRQQRQVGQSQRPPTTPHGASQGGPFERSRRLPISGPQPGIHTYCALGPNPSTLRSGRCAVDWSCAFSAVLMIRRSKAGGHPPRIGPNTRSGLEEIALVQKPDEEDK
jgi:hypothetical protein